MSVQTLLVKIAYAKGSCGLHRGQYTLNTNSQLQHGRRADPRERLLISKGEVEIVDGHACCAHALVLEERLQLLHQRRLAAALVALCPSLSA